MKRKKPSLSGFVAGVCSCVMALTMILYAPAVGAQVIAPDGTQCPDAHTPIPIGDGTWGCAPGTNCKAVVQAMTGAAGAFGISAFLFGVAPVPGARIPAIVAGGLAAAFAFGAWYLSVICDV